jgi:AraC-like DNA-binding protein
VSIEINQETPLRRARDVMDRDFADSTLDLDRIAAVAFLSKSYFVRRFSRQFGLTPGAYLTGRRIERAQDLLRIANLNVTEVCTAVGYVSMGSFSSAFLAATGESPSTFQRRWRGIGHPRIPGCEILMHTASGAAPSPN